MALLVAAALGAPHSPPKAADATTQSYGVGRESCAQWLGSDFQEHDGVNWLLGFWSALNVLNPNSHVVGAKTDGAAIVGEVRALCIAQPTMPLQAAVGTIYGRMLREGK